jgi:hypothetical protein
VFYGAKFWNPFGEVERGGHFLGSGGRRGEVEGFVFGCFQSSRAQPNKLDAPINERVETRRMIRDGIKYHLYRHATYEYCIHLIQWNLQPRLQTPQLLSSGEVPVEGHQPVKFYPNPSPSPSNNTSFGKRFGLIERGKYISMPFVLLPKFVQDH